MWPFSSSKQTDPATTLREQARLTRSILAVAFDSPGPLYSPDRRTIMTAWLSNFASNLDAAVSTIGRSPDDVRRGLKRMCDDYGMGSTMRRLGDVCGPAIRKRFKKVLRTVKSV